MRAFTAAWMTSTLLLPLASPLAAQRLLVGNKGENTVSIIDLRSGKETARVSVGIQPHEIAVSPNGRKAAVVAYGGAALDMIDVPSAKVVGHIDLGANGGPHGIKWLSRHQIVTVADKSNALLVVDTRSGSFTAIPTGQKGSHMLAISPDRRTAYVSNILSGSVSVIDLIHKTKARDIVAGGNPEGLALTRDGKQLWIGDDSGPKLKVVDVTSGTILATLTTNPFAIRVAISPDGKTAVTSNYTSGSLDIFDVESRTPRGSIIVSGEKSAYQVTVAFIDNRRLLVAETGKDRIAEVDLVSRQVLRRIPAGKSADGIGLAP